MAVPTQKITQDIKTSSEVSQAPSNPSSAMLPAFTISANTTHHQSMNPYLFVEQILKKQALDQISECNCFCFQRSSEALGIRNAVDLNSVKIVQQIWPKSQHATVALVSLGAENLKQEATLTAAFMQQGYHVEWVLINHNFRSLSKKFQEIMTAKNPHGSAYGEQVFFGQYHDTSKTLTQFEKLLNEMQSVYKTTAKVIGTFSSLEVYKSILAKTSSPVIPASYYFSDKLSESINAIYKEEHQKYSNACGAKVPNAMFLIDDITELDNPHHRLTLRYDNSSSLTRFSSTLYDEMVKGFCEVLKNKTNQTLFISTRKSGLGENAELDISLVNVNNPTESTSLFSQNYQGPAAKPSTTAKK